MSLHNICETCQMSLWCQEMLSLCKSLWWWVRLNLLGFTCECAPRPHTLSVSTYRSTPSQC